MNRGLRSRRPCPKVLVIDPYPPIRIVIGRALANEGYKVDAASSLEEGCSRILAARSSATPYGVVILDYSMDNLENALHQIQAAGHSPALIVTSAGVFPSCHSAGSFTVLLKPFTLDELLRAVRDALRDKS